MRSLIIATALCLSAAASAQAVHANASHMVAIMGAPAFAFQSGAIHAAGLPRVFSGIIAPVRLTAVKLAPGPIPTRQGEVVLQYTVNTAGVPEDVHVVKPLGQDTDKRVVEAVQRVRYAPGQLNGSPIATPVTLRVAFTQ